MTAEREPIPGVGSCACGFVYYDARRQCWKCGKRPCSECGKDTGSVFIRLCIACAQRDETDELPYTTRAVQVEPPKPPPAPEKPAPKSAKKPVPKSVPKPKPKPKGKKR